MTKTKDHYVSFAWLGILGIVTFVISWICAIAMDPSWTFAENTLSEFGISDTDARYFFNYGCCIISGALIALFGFGNIICAKNSGYQAGGVLLMIAGAMLALVGLVTMDVGNGNLHNYVAGTMALFLLLSMIALAAANWIADRKMLSGISIVFVCVLVAMMLNYTVAELEAYGVFLIAIWLLTESVRMIITRGKD
jgi:Predicted membrane protein